MAENTATSLVEYFGELEDPRVERTKLHQLSDIIVIAVCAVICGADSWVEIEEFGRSKARVAGTDVETGAWHPIA